VHVALRADHDTRRAAGGLSLLAGTAAESAAQAPGRSEGTGSVIGLEYQVLDNQRLESSMAAALAATGMTGMKHYVEAVQCGEMLKEPDDQINYTRSIGSWESTRGRASPNSPSRSGPRARRASTRLAS
jgi:hypothetical protein